MICKLYMFTAQKIKLFFNDPKFFEAEDQSRQISQGSQEDTINKIYAGQKQIRRSKVVMKTTIKTQSQSSVQGPKIDVMTDFLQSRIHAFENKIVSDIQATLNQKQIITEKYSQAEYLYEKAQKKLQKIMKSSRIFQDYSADIDELQKQIEQIQKLYEQNTHLKAVNEDIKKRIQQKQALINKK